jgi:hypothetical protein
MGDRHHDTGRRKLFTSWQQDAGQKKRAGTRDNLKATPLSSSHTLSKIPSTMRPSLEAKLTGPLNLGLPASRNVSK